MESMTVKDDSVTMRGWVRAFHGTDFTALGVGDAVAVLRGGAQEELRAMLADLRSGPRVADELAGFGSESGVRRLLEFLDASGMLAAGERSRSMPLEREWLEQVIPEADLADSRRLADRSAYFIAGQSDFADLLRSALDHLRLSPAQAAADAAIVVLDPSLGLAEMREWNRRSVATGQALLPVLGFNWSYGQVGPLIVPGQSACLECFLRRAVANVDYAAEVYEGMRDASAGAADHYPALLSSVASTAEILHRWIVQRDPELPGRMLREHIEPWSRKEHWVMRVPRCEVCRPEGWSGARFEWDWSD